VTDDLHESELLRLAVRDHHHVDAERDFEIRVLIEIGQELGNVRILFDADDGAYAAALVRHCGDMGYGPRRAREKLREKGVPQELWDEALDELPSDGEQIDRFLQSKLHGRSPEDKEKKRLTDALLRRGFSWGEVKSAWGRYGSEIWEE